MIDEYQLRHILYTNNKICKTINIYKIKNFKTFFGSPLKKFIFNIYNTFEIPKESFYISLFYINKFYNKNYLNKDLMCSFFNNINYFIFSSIILSIKLIIDESINVRNMCIILYLSFDKYMYYETELLKGLDWELLYDTTEYYDFKMLLVHYKDFFPQIG